MINKHKNYTLTEKDIDEVISCANSKLVECNKVYDVIGTQIFSILGLYARIIYYPLGENAPWGFTDIKGLKDMENAPKIFVVLNSSIPIECQVFAAAHELYHIWYANTYSVITQSDLDYLNEDKVEQKASRFAAEFLVNKNLLESEMKLYSISKDNINMKGILKLSELFTVPYKTMVRRLSEINILDSDEEQKYLAKSNDEINREKKRYSISDIKVDCRISIDNLIELALSAYEQSLITYERLEYLIGKCGITPEDVGITKKGGYNLPSDEELDEIMGD